MLQQDGRPRRSVQPPRAGEAHAAVMRHLQACRRYSRACSNCNGCPGRRSNTQRARLQSPKLVQSLRTSTASEAARSVVSWQAWGARTTACLTAHRTLDCGPHLRVAGSLTALKLPKAVIATRRVRAKRIAGIKNINSALRARRPLCLGPCCDLAARRTHGGRRLRR